MSIIEPYQISPGRYTEAAAFEALEMEYLYGPPIRRTTRWRSVQTGKEVILGICNPVSSAPTVKKEEKG